MRNLLFAIIIVTFFSCSKKSDSPDDGDQTKKGLVTILVNVDKNSEFYLIEPNEGKKYYTKGNTVNPMKIEKYYDIDFTSITITVGRDVNEDINLIVQNHRGGMMINKTDKGSVSYSFKMAEITK